MFHQSHHLAKKHTVHLSYVMFYPSAYEDAAEWCMQDNRKKKYKKWETSSNSKPGIFLLLKTSTNNLVLFPPFKNKGATQGNKKCLLKLLFPSLWEQQFFMAGSPCSNPCHVLSLLAGGDWQGSACIPSTCESRWNLTPDKQAAGNFPSRASLLNIYR